MENKYLGDFEIESGEILINDPCYYHDEYKLGSGVGIKAKKGIWKSHIIKVYKKLWGRRITVLYACHENYKAEIGKPGWIALEVGTGVDSGQAGIFDLKYFNDSSIINEKIEKPLTGDNEWYDLCCNRTLDTEFNAGIIPFGVVSSSGFGDGYYPAFARFENDEAICVAIDYRVSSEPFFVPVLNSDETTLFQMIKENTLTLDSINKLKNIDTSYFSNYCLYIKKIDYLKIILKYAKTSFDLDLFYIINKDDFETFDEIKGLITGINKALELINTIKYQDNYMLWLEKFVEIGLLDALVHKNILLNIVRSIYDDKGDYVEFWIDYGVKAYDFELNAEIIKDKFKKYPKIEKLLLNTMDKWTIESGKLNGKKVKVTNGAFVNLEGIVISQKEKYYNVELEIFGRKTKVELLERDFTLL